MGCCLSRNGLSEEEKLICYNERKLGFSARPSEIELGIKKWIGNEGLTLRRLKKAASGLGVNIDTTSIDDPLLKIISFFKSGDLFNVSQVIIFFVFLTVARPEEKAEVWFDILDADLRLQISFNQVKEFFSMIFLFTFKVLPGFAEGDGDYLLSSERVEVYKNECEKWNKEFVEESSLKICPEHVVDKETFLNQIKIFYKLSYPEGVRQIVRDYKIKPN